MKSFRVQLGIIPAVAALWLAACGGTPSGGAAAPPGPALIHTASMKVGDKTLTVLKNTKGLTLYYFTPEDEPMKVALLAGYGALDRGDCNGNVKNHAEDREANEKADLTPGQSHRRAL